MLCTRAHAITLRSETQIPLAITDEPAHRIAAQVRGPFHATVRRWCRVWSAASQSRPHLPIKPQFPVVPAALVGTLVPCQSPRAAFGIDLGFFPQAPHLTSDSILHLNSPCKQAAQYLEMSGILQRGRSPELVQLGAHAYTVSGM